MQVNLAYGKTGTIIHLPDDLDITIVNPSFIPGIQNPYQALREAINHPVFSQPLSELVKPGNHVGIIFSDLTRPTPNHLILPAILKEISIFKPLQLSLFNACGTHRSNTDGELRQILGDQLVDEYRIIQNDAFNTDIQEYVGKTSS